MFFFFLSTLFLIVSSAQTKDEQIKSIRKKFQQINSDTTLKKVTLESEEFLENTPDNGGELTGYYKNRKIKKIYEWIGLSNGINTREFYFDREQLIFVYEKFDSFVFDAKKMNLIIIRQKQFLKGDIISTIKNYSVNQQKAINL